MTGRTIPPLMPSPGMLFPAQDLNASIGRAGRYAGKTGRIATLPEIARHRAETGPAAPIWNAALVAATVEYVGRSRAGNLVLAVADCIGPLAETMKLAGGPCKNIGATRHPSPHFFRTLLDGLHGGVRVVDLKEYLRRRRYPLQETLTLEQALEDELARARLGEWAEPFLTAHFKRSREWLLRHGLTVMDNRCVLRLRDAPDLNYCWTVDAILPAAHFLAVSAPFITEHGHPDKQAEHDSLVTEIGCYGEGPAAVIGVRGSGRLGSVHPGEDILYGDGIRRHWRRLLRARIGAPHDGKPFYCLTVRGGLWFTQHARLGLGQDTDDPEFPVTAIEKLGPSGWLEAPLIGSEGEMIYSRQAVRDAAPADATAYHLPETPHTVWDGDEPRCVRTRIDFYRVEVPTERHIPPFAVLREDFDLLESLWDNR